MLINNCCLLAKAFGPGVLKLRPNHYRGLCIKLTPRLSQQQQPASYNQQSSKLIYEGKLTNRILYLKGLSIFSSLALAGSYSYVISQKGFSIALAGVGCVFTPFLLSPLFIAWFFKRYVTKLYYNPDGGTYTVHHYGLLLNKKSCTFSREDVVRSDVTSVLNTFLVNSKPFYLNDEDLIDAESVQLYKSMINLDGSENK